MWIVIIVRVDCCVLYVDRRCRARSDALDDVRIFAQPAVAGYFEKVGSLPGVWDENPPEKISSMGGDIFGKGEGRVDNVLVQQVDIIALGVGRIVVKR
jgi:hypothetical protein